MKQNSLSITEIRTGRACILALNGRIDSTNAEQLIGRVSALLETGDRVRIEISGIGTLENPVVQGE